jgi:fructokinase
MGTVDARLRGDDDGWWRMIRIGLDLGGTKIAGAAFDESGREIRRQRVATPHDYPGIVAACAGLAKTLALDMPFRLGICTPGAVDGNAGIIRFSPNVAMMAGKPFVQDLSVATGAAVKLANDAVAFGMSEARDGAASGARKVYAVILGTGVGGALIVDGQPVQGPHALMEWGHIELPWQDASDVPEACACGRAGDVESYLSGPALHRQLKAACGREIGNAELVEGLAQKDAVMLDVVERYTGRLAKALSVPILTMDPDVIVLGGGVSNLEMLYAPLPQKILPHLVVKELKTRIVKAMHGDDSGLRGAAFL